MSSNLWRLKTLRSSLVPGRRTKSSSFRSLSLTADVAFRAAEPATYLLAGKH